MLLPGLVGMVLAAAATVPLGAQEIGGRALDAGGAPLAEVPIALHRVGGGSGATVDAAMTDQDGRFRFTLETQDSALYFVAMRHEDRLYIGPPARGGAEPVTGYELRADPANEAGTVATALSGGPPPGGAAPAGMATGAQLPGQADSGTAAAWLVALLALVVAAIFLTTAPGYRRRRQREALVELATIENRLAEAGPGDDPEGDRRHREVLRQRLARHG